MSATLYDWLKVAHILAFVSWMAGLFYLPRLFVYHTRLAPNVDAYRMFCEMERKLLVIIMRPAAIATWLFGLGMAADIFAAGGGVPLWLGLKTALVGALTVFHFFCHRHAAAFEGGKPLQTERFYRFFNEAPTLLLLGIVILVVFKP